MLLVFTVLCFLLVNVAGAPDDKKWLLSPSVRRIYTRYMRQINPDLLWSRNLSRQAYLLVQPDVEVRKPEGPYFSIYADTWYKSFLSMEQQVLMTLYAGFSGWWIKIKGLDMGTPFGCNHRVYYHGTVRNLQVLCIYKIL